MIRFIKGFTEITDRQEHFNNISENEFVAVFFYDGSNGNYELGKKVIEELEKESYIKKKSIFIEFINFDNLKYFKKYVGLEDKNHFSLFIKTQKTNFKDLDSLLLEDNKNLIKKELLEFLKFQIDNIITEIKSFDELLYFLRGHKILNIYLGEPNENFSSFYELAKNHIKYRFFYSHEETLKEEILQRFSSHKSSRNFFFVIKHDSILEKYDSVPIIGSDTTSKFKINRILEIENNPRLRIGDYHQYNIRDVYWKNQILVVYFLDKNENQEKNLNIYKSAIKKISGEFIYTYCTLNEDSNCSSYLQVLLQNQEFFNSGDIFIIYLLPSFKLGIEKMNDHFNQKNLFEFCENFLQKFPYLYLGEEYFDLKKQAEEF